jgi:ribosomal-protein-alanine N-acetyltransferase
VRIRRANLADIPAMMRFDRQNLSAAHWSQQQYENLFLHAHQEESNRVENGPERCEALIWIAESQTIESQTTHHENDSAESAEPLAFLVAQKVDADWELQNIIVAPTVRRRGIASSLLKELIAYAVTAGAQKIFLEVRASNHSARALYMKMGFKEVGLRKGYYADPSEDAILCSLLCS